MLKNSLAIVIPSKNREQDIRRCLTSIMKQPNLPDQIVVIDQSQEPYQLGAFPAAVHAYNPHLGGLTAAKNYALQYIQSDFVLFLDDDVEMLNDCVGAIKTEFAKHPHAAAVACSLTFPHRRSFLNRLHELLFRHGFFKRAPIEHENGTELQSLPGGATAVRSSVLLHERFDESLSGYGLGEDFEFSLRAKRYGSFWLCRDAGLHHHVSASNRTNLQKARRDLWKHYLYFYDKMDAGAYKWNRLWLLMWMVGEAMQWVRLGMGLPPLFHDLAPRMLGKKSG